MKPIMLMSVDLAPRNSRDKSAYLVFKCGDKSTEIVDTGILRSMRHMKAVQRRFKVEEENLIK